MDRVRRIALAIYFIVIIPTMALLWYVVAPFFAKAFAADLQVVRWCLIAVPVVGGSWNVLSLLRDKDPLQRLGKIASVRPNSGSSRRSPTPGKITSDDE